MRKLITDLARQQQTNLSAAAFSFDITSVKVASPEECESLAQGLSVTPCGGS